MWNDPRNSPGYRPGAVCRRGHPVSSDLTYKSADRFCSVCGAEVLMSCPNCNEPIQGRYHTPNVTNLAYKYIPKPFCGECGAALPWATRQQRLWELENILDQQDISEAQALLVREHLNSLRNGDLTDDEQSDRWIRIKRLSPGLITAGRSIIESVATAAALKGLGLK
jgi:hypothetical protein